MEVTKEIIKGCLPQVMDRYLNQYIDTLVSKMNQFDINTPLRISHFLAQVCYESGNFKYNVELGNKSYFDKYDGKYGNTEKGDGYKFRGRGLIQLTFKSNYKSFGEWCDLDCVNHPELLEDPFYSVLSAIYYWESRNLNSFADKDDFVSITKKINGGLNGESGRRKNLLQCKKYFKI